MHRHRNKGDNGAGPSQVATGQIYVYMCQQHVWGIYAYITLLYAPSNTFQSPQLCKCSFLPDVEIYTMSCKICIVLYCIVFVLYCIVLYCIVLYCI